MATTKKKANPRRPHKALPRRGKAFVPPATITLPPMLKSGGDVAFRETLYLMALTFGRLHTCREAFGRALGLTASQFIVLIGTAYQQGGEGVSIRALADHTQLAATHVTTEVGRLIAQGLLTKQASTLDRRSVLVRLSAKGEDAVRTVNPLQRRVNDLLFADVSREEFAAVSSFLERLALNSEYALAEIRRFEREKSSAGRLARSAGQD
jgi:MarR family transcriptional regulator, organic hydroperoxide resistance regulator